MSATGARDKTATQEKEAKGLLKQAKGLTAPSLLQLRFKPDWDAAAPLLDRAVLLFKQAGNLPLAIEACDRAATAQERLGSQWHAAKHYETAAELSKKLENYKEVARFYKMCGDLYMEAGKQSTAAESLTKGARSLEEVDPEQAAALYYDALDIYESEGKEAYAADAFRYATAFLIKQERWADAVEVQMRFGAVSEKVNAKYTQNKAYLGAVVTWLYGGDAEKAWHTFQDAMGVESFADSEEAFAADALFDAYREQDEDLIKSLVKTKACFKQLDNQVARLAIKLPVGKLRRMARKLEKLMNPVEEGEEGQEGEEGGGEDALL